MAGKRKENLTDLEKPDNLTEVLLFKEAIALGWDCPRAAVLLIFRKLQSDQFTIQTVGRIMRMPEQKHYPKEMLNVGYVFTDIAKDKIQIVTADADYILNNTVTAYRRENLKTYGYRPAILNAPILNVTIWVLTFAKYSMMKLAIFGTSQKASYCFR